MDKLDENTIIIITSDHGWDRMTGHPFAPPGMILFNGKHIKKGYRMEGMNIYDIAPTVLYLTGLPVALDMDGSPVLSCLEDSFVEEHPVRSIPTYEEGETEGTSQPGNPEIENEMTEQLKTLGYID